MLKNKKMWIVWTRPESNRRASPYQEFIEAVDSSDAAEIAAKRWGKVTEEDPAICHVARLGGGLVSTEYVVEDLDGTLIATRTDDSEPTRRGSHV